MNFRFRPDIDFQPLIENRTMRLPQLREVFGRDVTDRDLKHCVDLFKTKHPALASQARKSPKNGLWLMGQAEASRYHARRVRCQLGGAITSAGRIANTSTNEMTAGEKLGHESTLKGSQQAALEMVHISRRISMLPETSKP